MTTPLYIRTYASQDEKGIYHKVDTSYITNNTRNNNFTRSNLTDSNVLLVLVMP